MTKSDMRRLLIRTAMEAVLEHDKALIGKPMSVTAYPESQGERKENKGWQVRVAFRSRKLEGFSIWFSEEFLKDKCWNNERFLRSSFIHALERHKAV